MNMLASGWSETEGLLSVEPASPHQLLYELSRETYAGDNSALTGREAVSVLHVPGPAVLTQPRHLAHPIWVSRSRSGLIAIKVIVPPHCVRPVLP